MVAKEVLLCLSFHVSTESLSVCILFKQNTIPPHIHAIYGDDTAEITIQDGRILEGSLPPKALSMVREWIEANKDDLMAIWNSQEFRLLKPLE